MASLLGILNEIQAVCLFLGPGLPPNAWVIFPEDGKISAANQHAPLTARPVNFSQSMASKLRHSFIKINNDAISSSTPVESITSQQAKI